MSPTRRPVRIVTRPATNVNGEALEDTSRRAVELITTWRGTVLRVDVLRPGGRSRSRFLLGEGPRCDLPMPPAALGGNETIPLVAHLEDGGAAITFPAGATGDVTSEDGRLTTFAALAAEGEIHPSDDAPGCLCVPLPRGAVAVVELGGFTFVAKSVPEPRPLPAPFKFDWDNQIFGGASLAFHFLVVCIAFFDVPDLLAMSMDLSDVFDKGVRYAPLEQEKRVEEQKKRDDAGAGKRSKDEEGMMGKRDAPRNNAKYAIRGPKDNPTPRMARDMAREAGILQYLAAASAPVSPFGDVASGQDPENALGALIGDRIGDNFGYGGLGVYGTGRGGGRDGEGTIGVGDLDTIGRDKYGRDKKFYEVGDPARRRPFKPGGPTVRDTGALVHGSLSKDAIRRVVHRHLNEVKFCYERELASRPDLSGRVSIKFLINGMGAVQSSAATDSTLGSAALDSCIAGAVRRWTFPQPEGGGVVIVTYPFQLETPES
jgi:hypothetical protein